tara:strand:+ start:3452 stop:4399 length:948 start_codon:yes stop_codon:yes gene_type:complete
MLGIATINLLAAEISSVTEELSLLLPVTKEFDLSNPFVLSMFLSDSEFRDCLTICRFKYFEANSDGKYATVKSLENNNPKALEKNYRVMADSFKTLDNKNRTLMSRRVDLLSKNAALQKTYSAQENPSILLVGPRSEYEIFSMFGHGFDSVTAIDIFTYSNLINIMDLMKLDPNQNRYDIIVLGYVLPYLSDPAAAIKHVTNCLNLGGTLIIGSTRTKYSLDEWNKKESSGISQFTKVVFSNEDELCDFVESSSENQLIELSRSPQFAQTSQEGSFSICSNMTCTFQKEPVGHFSYTSRRGKQIPLWKIDEFKNM